MLAKEYFKGFTNRMVDVGGDIQINTSGAQIDGILYAPNGFIQINVSNITINGRIIAKKVQINGSNIKITSSTGDLTCLPGGSVSLVE